MKSQSRLEKETTDQWIRKTCSIRDVTCYRGK